MLKGMGPKPSFFPLKPVVPRADWTVYFVYAPDGLLTPAHCFTLSRLRDLGMNLFVVCATRTVGEVPEALAAYADALYWKALRGFDFSAYALALNVIARQSPHARVLLLNDSVFGPFVDVRHRIDGAPWDLTGFTASSRIENHVQSYSFVIKDVTRARVRSLWPVFFPRISLNTHVAVTLCQETRLARVAARSMSVGAYWYADAGKMSDPVLVRPFELLDAGFPFLKKSLVGKHSRFNPENAAEAYLAMQRHPLERPL